MTISSEDAARGSDPRPGAAGGNGEPGPRTAPSPSRHALPAGGPGGAARPSAPPPLSGDGDGRARTSPPAAAPGTDGGTREGPGARRQQRAGATPATGPGGAALRDAAAPPAGEWTVELPAGLALLSANDREHWAPRNRTYQTLKRAAWAMTMNARVPRLERVTVTLVYDPPDGRRRDSDNLYPTLKACLDGIVATKRVISDDSARYVAATACEIGPRAYPLGRIRIIIREAAAAERGGAA